MGGYRTRGVPPHLMRAGAAEGAGVEGVEGHSSQLEVVVREGEGCARMTLRGELDVATTAGPSEQLAVANRTGVSRLIAEQQRATASGMTLRIESPTAFVRDILTVTGLIDYLGVSPEGHGGS